MEKTVNQEYPAQLVCLSNTLKSSIPLLNNLYLLKALQVKMERTEHQVQQVSTESMAKMDKTDKRVHQVQLDPVVHLALPEQLVKRDQVITSLTNLALELKN